MNSKIKQKSKLWLLTWPFAHNNFTAIGNTLYYPKNNFPSSHIIAHEQVHMEQVRAVGFLKFYFLYLFALPFLYNPWRHKWELEAFTKGTGITEKYAREILKSYKYGWLKNK